MTCLPYWCTVSYHILQAEPFDIQIKNFFQVFFPPSLSPTVEAQLVCFMYQGSISSGVFNHIRLDFGHDSKHHSTGNGFPPSHITWVVWSLVCGSLHTRCSHQALYDCFNHRLLPWFRMWGFSIHVHATGHAKCNLLDKVMWNFSWADWLGSFLRWTTAPREPWLE